MKLRPIEGSTGLLSHVVVQVRDITGQTGRAGLRPDDHPRDMVLMSREVRRRWARISTGCDIGGVCLPHQSGGAVTVGRVSNRGSVSLFRMKQDNRQVPSVDAIRCAPSIPSKCGSIVLCSSPAGIIGEGNVFL